MVERRERALAVPIIALTVRDREAGDDGDAADDGVSGPDVEGVFLMRDGSVTFAPVDIGIAGQEYFEVLSGLAEGDSVVAGPYQVIRQLQDGDAVRVGDGNAADDEGND